MKYAMKKMKGFTIVSFALVALATVSVSAVLSAISIVTQQSGIQKGHEMQIAFNSAERGIDYMTAYLTANRDRVSDGEMMTYNLPNGGAFRVQVHFIGNNDLVKIVSVGNARDGASPRMIHQLVEYNQTVTIPGTDPVTGYGRVPGGWVDFKD